MTGYVLSIEDERTVLAADIPGGAAPVLLAGLGRRTVARDCFKRDPPSPLELENAIAAIEDEIARVRASPAEGSRLRTRDPLVREIALAAGLPHEREMNFALPAVEQAFQRLAAQASRGVRSADGLAAGNEAAAALVILRELMHHLRFPAIIVSA